MTFKEMSVWERLAFLRESGIVLFPNLSEEDKRLLLHMEDVDSLPERFLHLRVDSPSEPR